jgi:hypothetical protein
MRSPRPGLPHITPNVNRGLPRVGRRDSRPSKTVSHTGGHISSRRAAAHIPRVAIVATRPIVIVVVPDQPQQSSDATHTGVELTPARASPATRQPRHGARSAGNLLEPRAVANPRTRRVHKRPSRDRRRGQPASQQAFYRAPSRTRTDTGRILSPPFLAFAPSSCVGSVENMLVSGLAVLVHHSCC